MLSQKNENEIRNYFEYSSAGVDVIEDGLKEVTFGEYLVDSNVISRFQLLRALQLQDSQPGVRLGECIAALGYLPYADIEAHLKRWNGVETLELN